MKKILLFITALTASLALPAQSPYVFPRSPLTGSGYAELPIGSIRPEGWLREQLQRQADGLTGHLDQLYPQVAGDSNAWLGGDGDAWERGPYWIDGLLPLAYILQDPVLIGKAGKWVEAILDSQQEDGYFGPSVDHPFVYGLQRGKTHDWWPKMVALKILKQYYLATGDQRAIRCLTDYFRYEAAHLDETPLSHWSDWGYWRGADNLDVIYWLYDLTGEPFLLDLGEKVHAQTADWTYIFEDGKVFSTQNSLHSVNLAQGFKAPSVWWRYSGEKRDLDAPKTALETIRHTIGLPTGLWAGDEQIHFGTPTRGSELCAAVEMMFSLEEMLRITGDIRWADQLERIAYNALPTQADDRFTAKQYYQQANQVACTRDWRPFSTPHDDTDVLYGTLNGYPCCLCNMHQGWPKFTRNLWYATEDGGLAALVYAPSTVQAEVSGGTRVEITETTDYPFDGTVSFTVTYPSKKTKKADFPLRFRLPGWCKEAVIEVNGEKADADVRGGVATLHRTWRTKDRITLRFRMDLRTESWYDNAWSILRGPLLFALKMEEQWTWKPFEGKDRYYGEGAWEVTSPTPWNYCLMRDSFSVDRCRVELGAPMDGSHPYPWNLENAPVRIFIPARTLPHWKAVNGSTGEIPYFTEDGNDTGADVEIELIPYGCTTLRISVFPTRIIPWDIDFRETY